MTEIRVWEYWEGPMPGYVELCVETVRRHYPEARVLDRAGFDELWEVDRDVPIDHLVPQNRADFVRVYLLRHHGGLWLDSEFVLLRPFDELAGLPPEITFAGYRIDSGDFTNNVMYSRPGDPVLRSFGSGDAAALEQGLLALADGVLAGRFAPTDAPHRELCLSCPGRATLCTWGPEHTLRERPEPALRS